MKTITAGMILLLSLALRVWSCLAPANIQGVAFTDGEEINLDIIQELGTEGVDFLVEGEKEQIAIRYQSHYDERATVYIGKYGLSYQENIPLSCMGVILNPDLIDDIYNPPPVTLFDFSQAVRTELEWLVSEGVLDLTQEKITTIASELQDVQNGGVQYWTMQNDVLAYNSWYDYDSRVGTWRGSVGGEVDGVNGAKGCGVINPEYIEFTASLEGTTSVAETNPAFRATQAKAALQQDGSLLVTSARPTTASATGRIVTVNGRLVKEFTIPAGVRTYRIRNPNLGRMGSAVYFLELPDSHPIRITK
ncbi:MAG: hypothetical protein ACOCW1_05265 [Chitinispirillaceae bacterium]